MSGSGAWGSGSRREKSRRARTHGDRAHHASPGAGAAPDPGRPRPAPPHRPAWVTAVTSALAAHPIAIAVAVAAAARLMHFTGFERSPLASALILDADFYHTWARQIAAGDWIGREVFYANPLYAYFLGLVYRLLGPSP